MKITRAIEDNNDEKIPKYARKPFNDHQWIYIAAKLREYADKEDSYYIDLFALSYGYSPYKFKKKWAADNAIFAEALGYAIEAINLRRNDMLTFSQKIVDRREWISKQPLYDQELVEWIEKRALMNKPEVALQSDREIHLHVNAVPNSTLVPPLPKEDNE